MKILTEEEKRANYHETLKGGAVGGGVGLFFGIGGLYLATRRYPAFRQLTLPLRVFLVTSSGTFGAIVTADHFSRADERSRHPDEGYQQEAARIRQQEFEQKSAYDKFMTWGTENRYKIVAGSWVAAMAASLGLVGRNPYLSTAQKLVQARVYAQSLTLAVLIASAVFEIRDQNQGEGRWETTKVIDPNDPEHKHLIEKKVQHHDGNPSDDQWLDMVESEEQRIERREKAIHEQEAKDEKAGKFKPKTQEKKHKKGEKKDDQNKKKSEDKN